MDELMLFTDGSLNIRSKIGFGAYLAASDRRLSLELLREGVKVRRFENMSSKENYFPQPRINHATGLPFFSVNESTEE